MSLNGRESDSKSQHWKEETLHGKRPSVHPAAGQGSSLKACHTRPWQGALQDRTGTSPTMRCRLLRTRPSSCWSRVIHEQRFRDLPRVSQLGTGNGGRGPWALRPQSPDVRFTDSIVSRVRGAGAAGVQPQTVSSWASLTGGGTCLLLNWDPGAES